MMDDAEEVKRKEKKLAKKLAKKRALESQETVDADIKKKKKANKEKKVEVTDIAVENNESSKVDSKKKKKANKEKKVKVTDIVDENNKKVESENKEFPSFNLEEWYKKNDIVVQDIKGEVHNPFLTFKESGLSSDILDITKNYEKPTPIQATCWPIILKKRDVVGIAETGSGKTMAFGIPALAHIKPLMKETKKPLCLILAPTRELVLQIDEQMVKAGAAAGISSMTIYGGVPKDDQRRKIQKGVQVIAACPGRLADLIEDGSVDISNVSFLILDEADRMLDLGFEKEVRAIIGATSQNRRTLMFSATWPSEVQKLAGEFLSNPVKVTVGSPDLGANGNITQHVKVFEDTYQKESELISLLNKHHSTRKNRILVFALYKKEASRIEQSLKNKGWNCVAIHGDMQQSERTRSFTKFKSGEVPILIATDVAARGLDIPNVEYVINYTFPLTIEDYVHRIGRTGRAGKKGVSYTFFTPHDKARSGELINLLKQTNQEVPSKLMSFGTTVKKKEHASYGAFFKNVDPNVKGTKITFDD